ncbi:MAG: hypothetical protein JXA93_14005 [Anaerolineae bacterium]|nr:hypothetical protein [Anaerolineae bacterium]
MFGSFTAGDSLRVYRLQRRGISLDLQRHLTQTCSPLRAAWLALLSQQAMGHPTYVLYDIRQGEGFIQIRYRPHQAAADVTFVAPALDSNRGAAASWLQLLEGASMDAASRGVQRIFASLPESSIETEVFHQAGFVLYAREDVYRLMQPPGQQVNGEHGMLRHQRPEDWPALQKLCVAITPQRVRQAEGGILVAAGDERQCRRYVWPGDNGDELWAAVSLSLGNRASWLRLLVHPNSRDIAGALVGYGLWLASARPGRPIYCNVRQYEGGVRVALEAAGFEPFATRTLTVKHTLAWSKAGVPELSSALKSGVELVPPGYHINGEPERQVPVLASSWRNQSGENG